MSSAANDVKLCRVSRLIYLDLRKFHFFIEQKKFFKKLTKKKKSFCFHILVIRSQLTVFVMRKLFYSKFHKRQTLSFQVCAVKNQFCILIFLHIVFETKDSFQVSMVNVVNGFVSSSSNLKTLVSIRTLRALRPLRAVSRWDGMRVI